MFGCFMWHGWTSLLEKFPNSPFSHETPRWESPLPQSQTDEQPISNMNLAQLSADANQTQTISWGNSALRRHYFAAWKLSEVLHLLRLTCAISYRCVCRRISAFQNWPESLKVLSAILCQPRLIALSHFPFSASQGLCAGRRNKESLCPSPRTYHAAISRCLSF